MKKRKAFLPLIGLGILVSFGIVACGGDNAGGGGGGTPVEPEEKEMVVTAAGNKKTLQIGETVQLSANEKDGGAAVSGVTWRSRAEAVATVDANGLVTAVGAGSATIRATKDGYATASISITVEKAPEKKANYELPFEDADHYNPQGYWGMQQMGMVYDTPVEDNGGATPDSTSLGWLNQGCKETLTFTSDKNVKVGIGIAAAYNAEKNLAETMTLKVNGTAINLTGKVCPGAEDGTSYYDFHNIELGEATLQATNVVELEIIAQQGINIDNFLIYTEEKLNLATVKPAVKPQIEVEPASVALQVGETQQLTVKADGQALEGATFRVANDGIATVSSTGLVTAVAKGKTTISVEKDGYKKASVDVTVTAVPVANLIQLEAEDGELFAPNPEDSNAIRVEEKASASGGKSVGYFQVDSTITIKYTSDKAFTAELTLCAAAAAMNAQYQIADCILSEALEIKWNDVALDLTGKSLPGNSSWNWENWQEVVLGDVNVLAQENVLVIKALAQGPNVDFVTLADKSGAPTPQKTDLTFNEEPAMASWADKTAYYWNDQNWCGSNVTMVEAYEQDGAYHLAYTATGACDYGLQLFYKNSDLTEGKEYTVSAKVKVEKAASIKINIDESAFNDFEAGEERTLSIDYTEAAGKSSLKLVFKAGDAYPENNIVISEVKWVEKGGEVPPAVDAVTFNLGEDGEAAHFDGSASETYEETVGEVKLSISDGVKLYSGARDAKGNGCLKLGTGGATSSFKIAVPAGFSKVKIFIAGYKANVGNFKLNGGEELSTTVDGTAHNSNDGEYLEVEVTPVNGEVTFETTENGKRAMINMIQFIA